MNLLLAIRSRLIVVVPALLSAQLMYGCASTGGPGQSGNAGQALIKEAQQALASGARERAQGLLEEAARSNPTDKQPWIKLGQLHFEQGRYAQAIVAGQEVLARDPTDQDAHSIILVSSLRVAAKSLEELSAMNHLVGDARTEAKKVTQLLRDTLGETVLVPVNKPTGSNERRNEPEANTAEKAPPKRVVKPARTKPEVSKPATATSSAGGSDPFRSLR